MKPSGPLRRLQTATAETSPGPDWTGSPAFARVTAERFIKKLVAGFAMYTHNPGRRFNSRLFFLLRAKGSSQYNVWYVHLGVEEIT